MGEIIQATTDNGVGRNKKFLVLSADLLQNKDLTLEEKVVLSYDSQMKPYARNSNLMALNLDLSDSAITRARKREALNQPDYIVIDPAIFQTPELGTLDALYYSRILSFAGGYNEPMSHCAEVFNVSAQKISDSRKKLLSMGLVEEFTEDNITYLRKCTRAIVETPKVAPTTQFKVEITASNDEPMTATQRKSQEFKIKYKDYLLAWDEGVGVVKKLQLPYRSKPDLQKAFSALVDRYPTVSTENFVGSMLRYYEYLLSEKYLYQLEKNQYCPRLAKATDIFDKFKQIVDFKNSPDRQYDPSKVLTFGG